MSSPSADAREWLEADGRGGFASGTVSGVRTRRYHALLLAATTPPTGRVVLVNGFEAWVATAGGRFALSAQRYDGGVVHPDGHARIRDFAIDPWPRWTYALEDGTRIEHECVVLRAPAPLTVLRWRRLAGAGPAALEVRLLFSGRDYHALHHENGAFAFAAEVAGRRLVWRPYGDLPPIAVWTNATHRDDPVWYRRFHYAEEAARGLDAGEDLASPGVLAADLGMGEVVVVLGTDPDTLPTGDDLSRTVAALAEAERARRTAMPPLARAADAYFVRRGAGRTIVAGYPWFTDWGRDTFIALRGLAIASGRLGDAESILAEWAGAVSDGMLPNRFPDRGEAPEFNSVDAALWFVVAVHDFLEACRSAGRPVAPRVRGRLVDAVGAIVAGYAAGTRHGIRLDADGLLACGEPGVQLTWMDAKVGDWVVTPRIGKPVEVEALWLNALAIAVGLGVAGHEAVLARGLVSFRECFWNDAADGLFDVVDADHVPGRVDAAFRPNQILAVGGLPLSLLDAGRARRLVDAVERRLWTPLGLRSLAPDDPAYAPRYEGGVRERDGAYHQGIVWPWLAGPFVEAWVRVHGNDGAARAEARARFLPPLHAHLGDGGLGHVSEIADAEPPHTPRGCPFQAWSLGELLRLEHAVLRDPRAAETEPRAAGAHPS